MLSPVSKNYYMFLERGWGERERQRERQREILRISQEPCMPKLLLGPDEVTVDSHHPGVALSQTEQVRSWKE